MERNYKLRILLTCVLVIATAVCGNSNVRAAMKMTPGSALEMSGTAELEEKTDKAISSAQPRMQNGCGLLGATGGVQLVSNFGFGTNDVLIPIPQLADSQIPITYAIAATPKEALAGCHFCQRDGSNVVLSLQLTGAKNEVIHIKWSAIVLIAPRRWSTNVDRAEPYILPTRFVESDDERILKLADQLWPADGDAAKYAVAIQQYIRDLKMKKPVRTLDAVGIMDSGVNMICTGNANLAAALLRAKHIPARTLAVIPPIAQHLEMHRVVEFFSEGQWRKFDPSMVFGDIPLKPWQEIIMARTTTQDERPAANAGIGSAWGCPYGQEVELSDWRMGLSGQEFFWTSARPVAEFDVDSAAIDLAADEWNRFLKTGKLSPAQIKAATATNAGDFLKFLQTK